MYSLERREKTVELYIKNGLCKAKTIWELEYLTFNTLPVWYEASRITGELHKSKKRYPKYSTEQKLTAIKWLTYITEFLIPVGKVYLSPLIDCFDGLPVSWTIGTSPDEKLVNAMLDEAISIVNQNEHPIIHLDIGCHYRWPG